MADGEGKSRERKINLAALRKQDQHACNILDTASSVAHYKFDATTEIWEKTEFEGSLFVYNRNENGTEVAMMIMNRLKKENFSAVITSDMEFKPQDPFLLCRTPTEIIGIWFYDQTECARVSALLSRIAELSGDKEQLKSEIEEALAEVEKKEAPRIDVIKMFTKAKEEFDKKQQQKENITKSASMSKFVPSEQRRPIILKRTNSFPDSINEVHSDEEGIQMAASSKSSDANTLMKLLQGSKKQVRKSRSRTLSYGEQSEHDKKKASENLQKLNASKAGDLATQEGHVVSNYQRGKVPMPAKPTIIDVAMLEAGVLGTLGSKDEAKVSDNSTDIKDKTKGDAANKQVDDKDSITTLSTLLNPVNLTPTKIGLIKPPMGRGKSLVAAFSAESKSLEKTTMGSPGTLSNPGTQASTTQLGDSPRSSSARRELGLAMKLPDPPSSGLVRSLMSPMQFKAGSKTIGSQDAANSAEAMQLNRQQFKDAIINLLQASRPFPNIVELLQHFHPLCSKIKFSK